MATKIRGVNTFSRVPGLPEPAARKNGPPPPKALTEQQTQRSAVHNTERRKFIASPGGRERLSDPVSDLQSKLPGVSGAEAFRTMRNMGGGMTGKSGGDSFRDQTEDWVGKQTGVHPLRGRAVPDINSPHDITSTVVPQRRWEDLHPNERAATLRVAKTFGVTPSSATRDYRSQLGQSHARALGAGSPVPYSQDFYSGPSAPRDRIEKSATENSRHPNWPRNKQVDPHVVQSVANSITSPRNKFEVTKLDTGEKLYPNDEHANTAIQHSLNAGPGASSTDVSKSVPNSTGPSGGGLHGNIRRAAFAAHELLFKDATPQTLRNPVAPKAAEKGAQVGNKTFGTPETQKTTAYVGAWMHPEDADSYLTTDVHTGHGFAAHLGTVKGRTGKFDEDGKEKLTGSDTEKYIAQTPHVHAFHDYVARQVHADLGLSPSKNNAQYLNRGQASQWGEERVQRPDLTDATTDRVYGQQHPLRRMLPGNVRGVTISPPR